LTLREFQFCSALATLKTVQVVYITALDAIHPGGKEREVRHLISFVTAFGTTKYGVIVVG
jgi:hypothetical protein